jgi:hypothetical protein
VSRLKLRMLSLLGTLAVLALALASPGFALDGLKVGAPVASFGAIKMGSCDLATHAGCKTKTLTLSNVGSEPILIGGFGIRDLDPATAALVPGATNTGCEFLPVVSGQQWSLEPGQSCTIDVAFNPVVKGPTRNALYVWSTDQSNPIAVIALFGVGT